MVIDGTEKTLDSSSQLSQKSTRDSFNHMYKMNSLEDSKTDLAACNMISIMDLNGVDKDATKLYAHEMLGKCETDKNLNDNDVEINTSLSLTAIINNLEAIKISECAADIKNEAKLNEQCFGPVDDAKNQHRELEKKVAQEHDEIANEVNGNDNDYVNNDDVLVSRGPSNGIPIPNHNNVPYNSSLGIPPDVVELLTHASTYYPINFIQENLDNPGQVSKYRRPDASVTDCSPEFIDPNNAIFEQGFNSTLVQPGSEMPSYNFLDLFDSTSNFTPTPTQQRTTVSSSHHIVPSTQSIPAYINEPNLVEFVSNTINEDLKAIDSFSIPAYINEPNLEEFVSNTINEDLKDIDGFSIEDWENLLGNDILALCGDPILESENIVNDLQFQGSPTSTLQDSGIGSPESQQMSKSPDRETVWLNSPPSDQCLASPGCSNYCEDVIEIRASSKRELETHICTLPANDVLDINFKLPVFENDSMPIGPPIPKCVEDYPTSEEIKTEGERKGNNVQKIQRAAKSTEKPKLRGTRTIIGQEKGGNLIKPEYFGHMIPVGIPNQTPSAYSTTQQSINYSIAMISDTSGFANDAVKIECKPEHLETISTTAHQPYGSSSTTGGPENKVNHKPIGAQHRPILPKPTDASIGIQNFHEFNLQQQQLQAVHQQQQLHQLRQHLQQQPNQLQQQQFNQQVWKYENILPNCLLLPQTSTDISTMTQQVSSDHLPLPTQHLIPPLNHQWPDSQVNNRPYQQQQRAMQILKDQRDLEAKQLQERSRLQQPRTQPRSKDEELRVYRWIADITKERLIKQDEHGLSLLHQTVTSDKTTPLQVEAIVHRLKREGLLETILAMGSEDNKTPLCCAVMTNRWELVKLLMENGADVNVKLRRAQDGIMHEYHLLHYIAKKGSIMQEVLKQLLTDPKINVDAFDSYGVTPLHLALKFHKLRCVTQNGENDIDSTSIIYILADMGGANLNIGDRTGKTPLHYAIESKDRSLVEWYLDLVVYVTIRRASSGSNPVLDPRAIVQRYLTTLTKDGMNALTIASALTPDNQQKAEIIQLLLQKNS